MKSRGLRRLVLVTLTPLASHCQIDVHAVTRDPNGDASTLGTSNGASTLSGDASGDIDTRSGDRSSDETTTPSAASLTSASADVSVSTEPSTSGDSGATTQACPVTATAGDSSITVAVGSLERSYVLHIPAEFDASRPAPLIIDFHGAGGSGSDQLQNSPYPAVTDRDGVIMAFPDGVNGPIGTAWNVGPCCVPGVDDLAFVDAMLADIETRACVDVSRVYAVGVLTGGGMAHYLACERSDVFAAVSPAAFDLAEETVNDCQPSQPVGVVAFRGTADERVPYEGGSSMLVPDMTMTFLGAQASFAQWASLDGCTGEPSAPDRAGCSTYTDCRDGVEVVLCSKENGPAEQGDASIAWPILARHVRQ